MKWQPEPEDTWASSQKEGWVIYLPGREGDRHGWINIWWGKDLDGKAEYWVHTPSEDDDGDAPEIDRDGNTPWSRPLTEKEYKHFLAHPEMTLMEYML